MALLREVVQVDPFLRSFITSAFLTAILATPGTDYHARTCFEDRAVAAGFAITGLIMMVAVVLEGVSGKEVSMLLVMLPLLFCLWLPFGVASALIYWRLTQLPFPSDSNA